MGDPVIAGAINLTQPVELEVTAGGAATTVSAMGRMVLRAQTQRESVHGLPGWLVPAFIMTILAIAFATWVGWSLRSSELAFPAMLSVLVASCPCALSLALPAVYAAASQRLLNEGILLTRGDALKVLSRINHVVFDKTGTLTRGYPAVNTVKINPGRNDFTRGQVLEISGCIESASAHPLARAFPTAIRVPAKVTVIAGKGMEAEIDGQHWRLGQANFADPALGPIPDTSGDADTLGDTDIWLADDKGWLARIELSDTLREGAAHAVNELAEEGLNISILSGDSEPAVRRIADLTGIENWQARQSPGDKLRAIQDLKEQGKTILMIGDGVNDAPVLAAADVSMTVKGGSELAHSAADIVLTGESLELVIRARAVATQAQSLIRQNLTWALLYNVSVLPLAISGILQPWMAALGMSLSSLLVVANATRLVKHKDAASAADEAGGLEIARS